MRSGNLRRARTAVLGTTLVLALIASGCSRTPGDTGGDGPTKAPEPEPVRNATVTVTPAKGEPMRLTGFYRNIVSHHVGSEVFTGEPMAVETPTDDLGLWSIGPGLPVGVLLPFAIIQEVEFEIRPDDHWNINPYLQATVRLGDGQTLKGGSGGVFEGETSLGATTFRVDSFENEEKGIRRIVFEHTAATSHLAKPWGKHTLVLHKLDGTTLTIENAAFVKAKRNRNGCWLADEPTEEMDFETSGASVKVPWSKLRVIAPADLNAQFDSADRLTLTAADGTQTKGHCPPYIDIVDTVRGTMTVGGQYMLEVDFSLGASGKPTFTKVEFR